MIFQEGKSMAKKAIKQKPLVFENYYLGKSGIWFFMPDNYQKFKEKNVHMVLVWCVMMKVLFM